MNHLFKAFCILLVAALVSANADAQTKKVLLLAGQKSHRSGEHEFNAGCLLLAKALNEQSGLDVEATVIQDWPSDESVFDGVDAVIIYSDATKVVGKGWEKTDQLVKSGVGIMFMHYAVHPSPEMGEKYFRPWIGAAMETGYSVNPHWVAELRAMPDHAISNGVPDTVEAYDEFYYNMRFQKDRGKVLDLITALPTKQRIKRIINLWNDHGYNAVENEQVQSLMWGIEREDGGRGVGFVGGHYHRNWANDGFRQIVLNAIVWVAGMEVPADGVKSTPLTEDELNANLDSYKTENPRIPLPDIEEFKKLRPAKWVNGAESAAAKKKKRGRKQREKAEKKKKEKLEMVK